MARRRVLVVGAAVVDVIARPEAALAVGASLPGTISQSIGGVAYNVAAATALLSRQRPHFISVFGADSAGEAVRAQCRDSGLCDVLLRVPDAHTPSYLAMLDNRGDMAHAVADFSAMNFLQLVPAEGDSEEMTEFTRAVRAAASSATHVVCDGNMSPAQLDELHDLLVLCADGDTGSCRPDVVWWEPTSSTKASRVLQSRLRRFVNYTSPNLSEVVTLALANQYPSAAEEDRAAKAESLALPVYRRVHDAVRNRGATLRSSGKPLPWREWQQIARVVWQEIDSFVHDAFEGFPNPEMRMVLTMGESGLLAVQRAPTSELGLEAWWIPPMELNGRSVVNATGAGDCLVGAMLWRLMSADHEGDSERDGNPRERVGDKVFLEAALVGSRAAVEAIASPAAVPKAFASDPVRKGVLMGIASEREMVPKVPM
uniref:Carbohydrate kinase PfkB domain-containing protein n=1 Tax=Rhizochromulina marina TaxID=1034831 RepID=A0A7S2WN66_9STRA|mmetsp:Transcript_29053/g.84836  ORF Transcript_29053/g.84836 Transcript_29053/m.84836 type:complete len:428 (+) Transcript_29053:90-1373(+)|eukprot:CAMPEP_0118976640 /NCGR_PEP_ID=MMETSP1173-20130426/19318_1 /TAXON_ID=1034831 /ORGANISM="Rhizochromulina marina cf, Strain CCMP1243" /LENGTH=427 /DNA_ID=CAMNT_0006926689 /DNA_START=54 /DNA_END=1337 /DNA_ORIENTATION=+